MNIWKDTNRCITDKNIYARIYIILSKELAFQLFYPYRIFKIYYESQSYEHFLKNLSFILGKIIFQAVHQGSILIDWSGCKNGLLNTFLLF